MEPKDGWKKKKNVTIVLTVVIAYSEERKGAGAAKIQLTLIRQQNARVHMNKITKRQQRAAI